MKIENLKKTIERLREEGFLAWQKEIEKNGGEIFLVGGAVRDALLGDKEIKDYDFVVRGIESERLEKILKKLGRVELVGKNFGVYKFIAHPDDQVREKTKSVFDIALPRTEISLATGGYKDFKVSYDHRLKIEDDLGRRDFTINALAWDLKRERLIDEFGGVKDLEIGIIRTVGNAQERFQEDYSRMLRAIRFACQLDFQIEKTTQVAIKKMIKKINDERGGERIVPREIVGEEILKAFVNNPIEALDLMDKFGLLVELMPELLAMKKCPQPKNWHSEGDVWTHTRLALKNLSSEAFRERFKEPIIFDEKAKIQISNKIQNLKSKFEQGFFRAELTMAVLFHDVGKPLTITTPEKDGSDRIRFSGHDEAGADIAEKIFKKWKFSAAPDFEFEPERVSWLIRKHHLFDKKRIKEMKVTTIEKYFFGSKYSGEDLLKLGFIDQLSSIPEDKSDYLVSFDMMVERIEELKKLGKGRYLPKPLLDGNEVMKILKVKSGKWVGKILEDLREKQLVGKIRNKKEAEKEVRRIGK